MAFSFRTHLVYLLTSLVRVSSVARLRVGEDVSFKLGSHLSSWDGLDESVEIPKYVTRPALLTTNSSISFSQPKVHILGLQDTGTNLVSSLLWQNFRDQLVFYDSTNLDTSNLRKSYVWKHANIMELFACNSWALNRLGNAGVTAIAMVRDPLSWMQSIRKAPYDFKACVEGEAWLSQKCLHHCPAGFEKCKETKKIAAPVEYDDLAHVWASWNEAYSLLTSYGFTDAIVVRYEDLVSDPGSFLLNVSARMNLSLPAGGTRFVTEAAKNHGDAVGREAALEKITHKTYLWDFDDAELFEACKRLQPFERIRQIYGYNDCTRLLEAIPELETASMNSNM
eukprot:TRINITY_DN26699_c0_g1_i1.p1 TRINITY_DN26699_c0_g1~~TRINITY_DN26699_c0_g1_i1.p1  ORF type:complete len:338 (+),score=32.90 TRINITY_DN26699_c0_g1_i1:64-1077(+)